MHSDASLNSIIFASLKEFLFLTILRFPKNLLFNFVTNISDAQVKK